MSRVSTEVDVAGTVPVVAGRWFDTGRWRTWVEGLEAVESVSAQWPAGGGVVWRSGPAGRGRVTETVIDYTPLEAQTVSVADDAIDGEQTIAFAATGDGQVAVRLALEYRIRRRNPLTPVVDWLFVRGAMRRSLEMTLSRFAAELASAGRP